MAVINSKQLVDSVADVYEGSGIPKKFVEEVIDLYLAGVYQQLTKKNTVILKNIGRLYPIKLSNRKFKLPGSTKVVAKTKRVRVKLTTTTQLKNDIAKALYKK